MLIALKQRLGLEYPVTLELVAKNQHLISVETVSGPERKFLVKVEVRMLELLGAEELEAALHTSSATYGSSLITRTCRPSSWPTTSRCAWSLAMR